MILAESTLLDALGPEHSKVETHAVAGLAGRVIIDAARGTQAELIVLAARSAVSARPGSVTQYVLRNARCPVLMVPPGEQER